MADLIFNAVLRADSQALRGFYRVIAEPIGQPTLWLAYIGPLAEAAERGDIETSSGAVGSLTHLARATLTGLEKDGLLVSVDLRPIGRLLLPTEDLKANELALWDRRRKLMTPFLDHEVVAESLIRTLGIGPVVQLALAQGDGTRATVYRLWRLLCEHGFDANSLHPRFDRCGAPGVLRPFQPGAKKVGAKPLPERVGETISSPQRPTTEADRIKLLQHARLLSKPGVPFGSLYDQLIERVYVTQYQQTDKGRLGIVPPQGTFPNKRQVRHILETGVTRLERVLRATTLGHFQRNLRGLRGKSHDGVAGPGHAYAIDATIGDIHLRSSVNPAWSIGRPIVYMVVDIWSTAIVGFYVCLHGPSWETAKSALFSSCCAPRLLAELWGFDCVDALFPTPTLPFQVWTDRGEYVSAGARETCLALGINFAINPAYRPDLKGMVEVLHRIAKDKQYQFLPGAINARRKELELKPSAKESAMTMRQYVHYLHEIFSHYNLFADRSHRLTMEMIGADVAPTPAGLWRFGHEAGIGYRKALPGDRLITGLLKRGSAMALRNGIYLESLEYEGEIASVQQWTAHARNFGAIEKTAFHFPGSVSRFWWPDPQGSLHEFRLRENARAPADVSLDEWRDAVMFDRCKKETRESRRLQGAIETMGRQALLREQAIKRAKEADDAYEGPKPTTRDARRLESMTHPSTQPLASAPTVDVPEHADANYDALMDEVFFALNCEAGQ